ncbi:MAG: phosphatase PAP2 family protein, partial [Anaerolineales bacterium]|nr:phosphatase PAP2 family protein [Anaerolineales bacterium]
MIPILDWGYPIIYWLQSLGDWLTPAMQLFTFLGNEEFFLLVLPALLWCVDIGLGVRVGLILLASNGTNAVFKLAFGTPRPYWANPKVKALSTGTSFGLPSGHAQTALSVWGRVAAWIRRSWAILFFGALILLISISRPYLGVHYPTDTLLGWLIGGVLLAAFLIFDKPVSKWLSRLSVGKQSLLSFVISIAFICLGLLVSQATANRPVPMEWITGAASAAPGSEAIDPLSINGFFSTAGTFFGLGAGAALLYQWGGFHVSGPWWQRLLRYLVGLVGVVLIYFGFKMIFPSGDDLLANIFRYIRYGAVGFWVAYLGPRVFALLRLANEDA